MKKVLCVVIAMLLSTLVAFAQDQAVSGSEYVGVFYTGSYDNNGSLRNDVTFRVGGDAVLPIVGSLTLNARSGYEMGPSTKGVAFGKFYLEHASCLGIVSVGYLPRPITLAFRPAPLSADGHSEFSATAVIPGCGTGVRVKETLFDGGLTAMIGAYYLAPSQSVEWNASTHYKFGSIDLRAAGYASRVRKGVGVGVLTPNASLITFTTSDSLFTSLLSMSTTAGEPYVNVNYNRNSNSFSSLEFGITKTYRMPYAGAQMLVGIGYEYRAKVINTYIQLFL